MSVFKSGTNPGVTSAGGYGNRFIRLSSTLEHKMDMFRRGELKGFALDSPYNGTNYTNQDWLDLAATGCNVVRAPIVMTKNVGNTFYDFPETTVAFVETALKKGAELGFRVIVVLQTIPTVNDWWVSTDLKNDIIAKWVLFARRLKGYSALQAYDIMNEPNDSVYTEAVKIAFAAFAQQIVIPLRAEDPNTPIMIEPAWYALADSFWQHPNVTGTGIVWSMHMYERREVCLQGLVGYPTPRTYDPVVDKAFMYSNMLETRKFATLYNVPIFVGEFSCVRWAPNGEAATVMRDIIEWFDRERWGYTYHVWRAYEGWDSEINHTIPQDTATPANRSSSNPVISLLRSHMKVAPRVVS